MINYDTKNWTIPIKTAFGLGNAYDTKELFKIQLAILIYTATITLGRIYYVPSKILEIHLDPTFLSLVGVILGLTLVFRINSAYDRWWEGRKLWGALINDSRTMASNFHSILPQSDKQIRHYLASQIANFAYALKGHLREGVDFDVLDAHDTYYIDDLKTATHIPHKIATNIFLKMEELYKKRVFSEADKMNIKHQIEQLINIMGACERIKNSPIPFSHTSFIKTFIFFYCLFLPIGLVDKFQLYTIPAVFLISYALAGVEVISEEIEQPFGVDANDLPLRHISNVIKANVYEIMQVPLDQPLPNAKVQENIFI